MANSATSRNSQKRQHSVLSDEIADLLLGPDSPVQSIEGFKQFIGEHDRLMARQTHLRSLDVRLVEVLPRLEQVEGQLANAETQLAAESKKLAAFAGELGKAAFDGFRAGELPDQSLFADRKELQARIDSLQEQKADLTASENAGMLEKAKVQAHQLKLAGQIKFEEFKVGSVDRAFGESLLKSKENLSVHCSHTEEVLAAIIGQRKQVTIFRENVKQAEAALVDRKSAAAETLGRSTVLNVSTLKSELKEARKEHRLNEKAVTSVRSSVIAKGLETESLHKVAVVGEKLRQLWSSDFDLEASKPQWMKLVNERVSRFRRLPPRVQHGSVVVAGVTLILLTAAFFGKNSSDADPQSGSGISESSGIHSVASVSPLDAVRDKVTVLESANPSHEGISSQAEKVEGSKPQFRRSTRNRGGNELIRDWGEPKAGPRGLERIGCKQGNCLICSARRSEDMARAYSDSHGFGLCGTCGAMYSQYEQLSQNIQNRQSLTPHEHRAVQEFIARLQHFSDQAAQSLQTTNERVQAAALLGFFVDGKFASKEWDTLIWGD